MLDFPRWKIASIIGLLAVLCALAIPSFLPESVTNRWPVHPRINLGLDLAGGSYLLLEADTADLANTRIETMRDQVATEMRRGTPPIQIGDISTRNGQLSFLLRDPSQVDAARERLLTITGGGAGMTGQRQWDISVVDTSRFVLTPTQAGLAQAIQTAMQDATEVVRRRIDELGTREPTIVQQGDNRIVVQVPGLQNPQALKDLLGKTAKLEFKLVDQTANPADLVKGIAPLGSQVLAYPTNPAGIPFIAVKRAAIITGDQLSDARQGFDQQSNAPNINITFNSQGGSRFARVTQENVGKPFAIIIDNKVISAPTIETAILGGSAVITGSYTVQSANEMAIALRSGKLAIGLKVIEESTVRAELGADSIHAGILASAVAVALVVIFMFVTYGRFGLYANLAVIINVFVILGILALLNGTLDAAGHRGLRPDDRHRGRCERADQRTHPRGTTARTQHRPVGRTGLQGSEPDDLRGEHDACDFGPDHARAGLGPGQGLRGRAADRHRDVGVHRGDLHPHAGRAVDPPQQAQDDEHMKLLKLVPDNTNIDFVALRKWAFGLTLLLSVLAVGLVAAKGLNFGVDFKGGLMIEEKFAAAPDLDQVRTTVDKLNYGDAALQQYADPTIVSIRLPVQQSADEGATNAVVKNVEATLAKAFPGATFTRYSTVSGKVSGELERKGILAVALAVLGIGLFAIFRFEWQFGVSTVVAIVHDLLMTLGFFALFRFEFDLNIVAAGPDDHRLFDQRQDRDRRPHP